MLSELNQFYEKLEEPEKSCFLALRDYILSLSEHITPEWKYKLPFFYFKGKMFCYLWMDKKTKEPYIGIAKAQLLDFEYLVQGDRKRMKILPIPANEDLPIGKIKESLGAAMQFYN
ncbi:DUF1801 domain-containing protein [Salibacteraceae bacterium]|nr:DUF1801 domain-containing protein [Salibacteraceae bacterium]